MTSGTDAIPGMPGFAAGPGYDPPTGLGTVGDARQFTAAQSGASHAVPATAGPAITAPLIGGRPLLHLLLRITRSVACTRSGNS